MGKLSKFLTATVVATPFGGGRRLMRKSNQSAARSTRAGGKTKKLKQETRGRQTQRFDPDGKVAAIAADLEVSCRAASKDPRTGANRMKMVSTTASSTGDDDQDHIMLSEPLDLVINFFPRAPQSSVKSSTVNQIGSAARADDEKDSTKAGNEAGEEHLQQSGENPTASLLEHEELRTKNKFEKKLEHAVKIENNSEILYLLRSAEKHGLFEKVNGMNIRNVWWIHHIPGLSRYFIIMPDDTLFAAGSVSGAVFFSKDAGESVPGKETEEEENPVHRREDDDHEQHHVAEGGGSFSTSYFATPVMYRYGTFSDGPCLGGNTMTNVLGAKAVSYGGKGPGQQRTFFQECHTNGGCRHPPHDLPFVLNIQGNGISDEYPKDRTIQAEWQSCGRFGGPKVFALLDSFERVGTAANCIRLGAVLLLPKMLVAVYGHGFVSNFDAGFNSKNHAYYENAVFPFGGDGQNWALGSSWQCGFFGAGWYLVAYALLAAGVGPTAVVVPLGKNAPSPVGTKMTGSAEKKKRASSGGRRKSAAKRTSSTGRAKK
eukprot:g14321.t1